MVSDKEADVILKFMEMTINRVNRVQASLFATQQVLIEKGIVTEAQLCQLIEESMKRPQTKVGAKVLEAMVGKIKPHETIKIPDGSNKERLEHILSLIDTNIEKK